jgi:hypothetical protein
MDFGEIPIHVEEPQLTSSEVIEIIGISAKSLQNWIQRGVVSIGTMHRTGRRLFSVLDTVELSIVHELSTVVSMPAAQAASAAAWARKRGFEMTERDETGKLKYRGTKHSPRHFLLIYVKGDDHRIRHEIGTDWLTTYVMEHPYVVVPIDEIVSRIQKKALDVLEREFNKLQASDDT